MYELLATNSALRIAFLILLFAAVVIGVTIVSRLGERRSSIKTAVRAIGEGGPRTASTNLRQKTDDAWSQLADRIEKTGLSLTDTKADSLRDKLRAAGYTSPGAPKVFTLVRLLLVVALPGAYFLLSSTARVAYTFVTLYIYGGVLALIGLYLPNLFVTAKADRRREEVTNGFPDCLDLMLVCVEAGLGLEAAMERVGREMVNSHPLVARLLSTATLRLRAGMRSNMSDSDDTAFSAGIGLNIVAAHIDLGIISSENNAGASLQFGVEF